MNYTKWIITHNKNHWYSQNVSVYYTGYYFIQHPRIVASKTVRDNFDKIYLFTFLKKKKYSKSKDHLVFALHREFRGYLNFQIGINVNQNFWSRK